MPHGCFQPALQEVIGSEAPWPFWHAGRSSSHSASSFLDSSDPGSCLPLQPHQRVRHGAHLGSSFLLAPRSSFTSGPQDVPQDELEQTKEQVQAEVAKESPIPGWTNTEGLPSVTQTKRSDKYFSPDLADAAGDGQFKPIFGCKCGDWQPSSTHPVIKFREPFLQSNPLFTSQLRKVKVHMEDVTANKVHWDATYDMRKYLGPLELQRVAQPGGSLTLTETMPAEKGSGEQLRFMNFCPGEGQNAHEYSLKVTALNENEEPIDGFLDEESTYSGVAAAVPGPIVATAQIPGGPTVATARM